MLYLQQTSGGGGGEESRGEHVSHQTWLAEVENEATATSVCGLEISFQSIPQERSIFFLKISSLLFSKYLDTRIHGAVFIYFLAAAKKK
jgi:hypothetical protein